MQRRVVFRQTTQKKTVRSIVSTGISGERSIQEKQKKKVELYVTTEDLPFRQKRQKLVIKKKGEKKR
jgi:hypothetical protein